MMKKNLNKAGSVFKKIFSGKKKKSNDLPYSDSGGRKQDKMSSRKKNDPGKTRMGIQAGYLYDPQTNDGKQKDIETCPKCQYPLRIKPDSSSPCPNCGFSGSSMKTVFDSGKTISISSLSQESGELPEFKFKLIKEDDKSIIEIQSSDEPEVILNRGHLDPDNSTISSDQHVVMRFRNHKIFTEDVSSNGSTFIQAKNKMLIQNNARLVIGNKIFIFNQSGISQSADAPNKTRKFGEFDLRVSSQADAGSGFSLTDEVSGKKLHFDKTYIIINRSILDPGNNSISASRHAEFEYGNGQWYVKDLSSNGSTFIQLKNEQLLENKIRIILGNKIFRFEYV